MKKFIVILTALLFCMMPTIMAEKKSIVIIKQLPPVTPKSPNQGTSPLIGGEYDTEELTIFFGDYDGDVTITLVDASTYQLVRVENETVFSPDTVSIDLSTLPSSTYYIFIELDNGVTYYATIQI